jgi:hypothetical protein
MNCTYVGMYSIINMRKEKEGVEAAIQVMCGFQVLTATSVKMAVSWDVVS